MKMTGLWWRKVRFLTAARVALAGKKDRDLRAAEALFRLNKAAKGGGTVAGIVYQLKTMALRKFYEKGFCAQAVKSLQVLECWHTQAYLDGRTKVCPKCGNTGVFRKHELFAFTFVIGGTVFRWHQPDHLVDWPVKISAEPVIYQVRDSVEIDGYGRDEEQRDQMMVWMYLRLEGVKGPELLKLRSALREDWKEAIDDLKLWVWRELSVKDRPLPGWLKKRVSSWASDIPF